ncbi:hypothetical protein BDV34DRAFT_191965 [Aspergillus parasiticus]|uniref:Uncharacterized protein n=1 Tax=Aspergillus parasiticus TaxID=5067 RepID=A0A5N6DRV8_ASPPA|nr:hypothetical protein BDV34DRAFT_191965 [Aspergillus parasiticus]
MYPPSPVSEWMRNPGNKLHPSLEHSHTKWCYLILTKTFINRSGLITFDDEHISEMVSWAFLAEALIGGSITVFVAWIGLPPGLHPDLLKPFLGSRVLLPEWEGR